MSEQLNEYETRLQRLQQLKEAGVIPYANKYDKTHTSADLISLGDAVSDSDTLMSEWASQQYSTAGRMMSFRTMGKLSFATLRDATGDIQICFVKNHCHFNTWVEVIDSIQIAGNEVNSYKFAERFLDIGDFVWVKGELFVTKHGELTIFINEYQLLSKALRPLGDKWHGIQDEEKLYRQRYLDMTMNEATYKRFLFKTDFYQALREFYVAEWFQEIVTSVLWNAASGAAARPFITHHHDYNLDVYLRIAFEPGLKMATAGRYEKVFEIGKDFRNEWSDPSHVQEFTQVEHYAAWWNYEDNMVFAEKMFDTLFDKLQLSKTLQVKDKEGKLKEVNRSTPRERIDYIEWVKKASGGLDITQYENTDADQKKLLTDIKKLWHSREWMETQWVTTLIDYLYKKVLRPNIIWPAFVYNYPKTMQPLARQSDANPNIVEQFQVVVNGWEIIKAYSELVDPTIQQDNFDEQAEALAKGDDEATSSDDDFMLAMEHGMPCQSWFWMWIERILALLTQQDNLRDVIMFPLMKPKNEGSIADESTLITWTSKNQDTEENSWNQWNTKISVPESSIVEGIVDTYLTDTKKHCQQVAWIMKAFAKQLWKDEHYRWTVGYLHDIDRDHIGKDPAEHLGGEFEKIVAEIDLDPLIIDDIRSHYDVTWVPIDSLIRKYLASVDELSWFVYAYSLMRPDGLQGMSWKSLNKKMKDKAFAKWVNREHLKYCKTYLDIPVSEFAIQVANIMNELDI